MRRRPIKAGDWKDRIWGNYPGLNTFALSLVPPGDNEFGIPQLLRSHTIPEDLFPFEEKSKYSGEGAIHFYCEDAYLNSLWNYTARYPHYPKVVQKAGVCLTPDFSCFTDWPKALNVWQVYKSRLLGRLWSEMGIDVIPSLMWGDLKEQPYLVSGLPVGGSMAVSTGHTKGDENIFCVFIECIMENYKPDNLLVYGQGLKPWLENTGINIIRYEHRRTKVNKERRKAKAM